MNPSNSSSIITGGPCGSGTTGGCGVGAGGSSSGGGSSTAGNNVTIRIEPTDEYKIQEISYDGQEKYIPPLSMSEHLSQLIKKIDFSQPIDELKDELKTSKLDNKQTGDNYRDAAGNHDDDDDDDENDLDEDLDSMIKAHANLSTISSWPFESMRAKMRVALTEICVLNDVLTIAKQKKYMTFDTVNTKPPDQRTIVSLMAKKRALQTASQILFDGVATLKPAVNTTTSPNKSSSSDWVTTTDSSTASISMTTTGPANISNSSINLMNQPTNNFYDELKEMRQNWRLKRLGNQIIGDLSYFRPAGYMFTANSRFEVIKTSPVSRSHNNQALSVKVPSDLEGRAHIQVSVIKNSDFSLVDFSTTANGRYHEPLSESTWQEKLESAQNVLFCKELFCHLAKEAVQHTFMIPATVTGNQIIIALFPDIKLYITLVHKTPNTKCSREMSDGMKKLQEEHKPVFEHSLHQMLRDFYANLFKKLQAREVPKEAGPFAIDRQTLFDSSRQDPSLDKMVQQSQHLIMRQQTMDVIDSFAAKIKDPLMISHWFCLNSPTTSIVRVDIVSHNNEILGRSHMLIYIGTRQLRVITRDCKNLLLGYEAEELRHLLIWQSCLHQFIASDKLSKLLGWYTLILNYNVNVTRQDIASTAFSLVICSSNCKYMISIKSGPQFGLSVDVAQFKEPTSVVNGIGGSFVGGGNGSNRNNTCRGMDYNDMNSTSIESILCANIESDDFGMIRSNGHGQKQLNRLQDLVENFREVDWDKMQGRDFLTKLELLMAALTEIR